MAMFDPDTCPHEIFRPGSEPETAVMQMEDGRFQCRFCGKIFNTKEEIDPGQYI